MVPLLPGPEVVLAELGSSRILPSKRLLLTWDSC